MKEGDNKWLVIDTDVACSSSQTIKEDPVSVACQTFLEQVKRICHRALITKDIKDEYKRHQSRYFRKWCKWMLGRKKLKAPDYDKLNRVIESGLESKIKQVEDHEEKEAILKDLHLIEAALAGDGIIISRDDKMAGYLKKYQDKISEFKELVWINPTKNPEEVIEWLERGAKPEEAFKLRN